MEVKIEALKNALQSGDTSAIRQHTDELNQVMQQVGAAMYQEAGPGAPPPPGSEPPGGGEEDVVEGEFSEA
jgi:molecular chaperone DnaK